MLLGRKQERHEIDGALASARLGRSATIAFVGEPGIGKTVLLEYASERADGMQILGARGIESEAQIAFASLLELLRPALPVIDRISVPQAIALEQALALRPGHAQDRFAVGAATLSLLAAYAEGGPVAVLLDDAHWVDESSAQALLFAFRRLVAEEIAIIIAARDDEPSPFVAADLPTMRIGGLTSDDAAALVPDIPRELIDRLHNATAGNPLAMLELAGDADELAIAPSGAPVRVSTRVSRAFLRRAKTLDDGVRRALVLAATSDTTDLGTLERAARRLGIDLSSLAGAESAGLVRLSGGRVEFRHPLARSALYAQAPSEQRRDAHRALAASLPDRDIDRRAWHLAAAAVGIDEAASAALEQAGARGRERSAYAAAAAAFERAARLTGEEERAVRLLYEAADAAWLAGLGDRAVALLEDARGRVCDQAQLTKIDHLSGYIVLRRGPVMAGHAILTEAAGAADPDTAVVMLAEAAAGCFAAGDAAAMMLSSERARAQLRDGARARARLLAATAYGMAHILGGDAERGAISLREAVRVAEAAPELREDTRLLPWLVLAPVFLREASTGRELIEQALEAARAQAAVGTMPFALNLIARDQATTDRWAVAEATYSEAIELARETGQQAELAFGLAGLAWLQARRGREPECRALAAEALPPLAELGLGLYEVWTRAALGELELGQGRAAEAAQQFELQQELLARLGITDADLSPAPELVETYLRLGKAAAAADLADRFAEAANAKGQPWSLARALRSRALVAAEVRFIDGFEQALAMHARTADAFELARTRLAYGERLRRARQRINAREQLRIALATFERLDARPWAERARAELAASGETLRRTDPSTLDELTPQELQIALLLASGKTTREAAAAFFLSPKTIEYHLRHVYRKLGVSSRDGLARALEGDAAAPAPLVS